MQDGLVIDGEDDRPIAVRRKRRSSAGQNLQQDAQPRNESATLRPHGIATPPSTPHRTKKRVRFSEPSPSTATGLTPFFCRSSLSSPPPSKSRRQSTPSTRWNLSVDDSPIICGTLQFAPLRQVLEGRVKRRLRRHRLSEEVNNIEAEEKCKKKSRLVEIELLKEEVRQKDLEIQEMKDQQDLASQIGGEAGLQSLNISRIDEKIRSLELQVINLRAELQRREQDAPMQDEPNWTLGPPDTFNDNGAFLPSYDEDFNGEMTDIFHSTPARRSFPSPPATVPNTPSKPTSLNDAGSDTSTTDEEKRLLESQLKVLQDEIKALSKTLELTNTTQERLSAKLAPFISTCSQTETESLDAAIDAVLTQLALAESTALDSSTRFSALSNELVDLFPSPQSTDPESILQKLHAQFRAARLELEYLMPGENIEGFENSKLLDMLVSRLRVLTKRAQQQDADIDQYHSQEISLRQQLGSHVDAMAQLQKSLSTAQFEALKFESELLDREESIKKLTHALQGYRDEVAGLETFINRLEVEHAADTAILRDEIDSTKRNAASRLLDLELKRDTLEAAAEGREMFMRELERRLSAAVAAARVVEDESAAIRDDNALLRDSAAETEKALAQRDVSVRALEDDVASLQAENSLLRDSAAQREKAHGDALALRDARVTELRSEIERVNNALKDAHEKILVLKREKRELEAIHEGEKRRGNFVAETMRGQLARAMETADGYLCGDVAVLGPGEGPSAGADSGDNISVTAGGEAGTGCITVAKPGPAPSASGLLFNASLARRRSSSPSFSAGTGPEKEKGKGKKRRRYDSGLGFLEEVDGVLEDEAVCG